MADDQVWSADETEHWVSRTVTASYEIRAKVQLATLNNQSQHCLLIRVYHSQWEWECLMFRNSTNIIVKKHVTINSITLKQCAHKVFSQFHRLQYNVQACSCCTLAGLAAAAGPGRAGAVSSWRMRRSKSGVGVGKYCGRDMMWMCQFMEDNLDTLSHKHLITHSRIYYLW